MMRVGLLLIGVALVAYASAMVLQPAPAADALREAEYLWRTGRISEGRRMLLPMATDAAPPIVAVRLAHISLQRGECPAAQQYVARALRGGALRRDEAGLAHLIAGQCAARQGDIGYAEAEWSAVDPRSPLHPLANVLRGEAQLHTGAAPAAARHFDAALAKSLAEPAWAWAHYGMALAVAGEQPELARRHLAVIRDPLPSPQAEVRAFLPSTSTQLVVQARQLEAIVSGPATARDQLLGQHLLQLGLYHLAIARFEQVPATAPEAVLARSYAAFTRWQLGQKDAALEQLRELASYAPQEPVVATLYATVVLDRGAVDVAAAALDAAEASHPLDPAIMVVRSDVLAARHDYAGAIAERQRALAVARPPVRARYALALAELHMSLTYQVCEGGVAAAREATALAPSNPETWQMLATTLYHCRDYTATVEAAQRGLVLAQDSAPLMFLLGAAQSALGQRQAGAIHLVAAADHAPASEWRRRAEEVLGW